MVTASNMMPADGVALPGIVAVVPSLQQHPQEVVNKGVPMAAPTLPMQIMGGTGGGEYATILVAVPCGTAPPFGSTPAFSMPAVVGSQYPVGMNAEPGYPNVQTADQSLPAPVPAMVPQAMTQVAFESSQPTGDAPAPAMPTVNGQVPYDWNVNQWAHPLNLDGVGNDCNSPDLVVAPDEHVAAGNPRRGPGSAMQRRRRRQRALGHMNAQHPLGRGWGLEAEHVGVDAAASLAEQLRAGGNQKSNALAVMCKPGALRQLSFDHAGCRTVQLAFEEADRKSAADLALGLKGSVVDSIKSPHANYVIQKIIKVLTPSETRFIVDEITAAGPDLARHEYGCRIYCRLLENAATDKGVAFLVDRALSDTSEMCRHQYGHFMVESALEHGLPHQRQRIVAALRDGVLRNAWNRSASYVLEKAFVFGAPQEKIALAQDLLSHGQAVITALAQTQLGSMILRAMLRLPEPIPQQLHDTIRASSVQAKLRATKHGRKLLEEGNIARDANSAAWANGA